MKGTVSYCWTVQKADPLHDGTAEPHRVTPPEAVVYQLNYRRLEQGLTVYTREVELVR